MKKSTIFKLSAAIFSIAMCAFLIIASWAIPAVGRSDAIVMTVTFGLIALFWASFIYSEVIQ